MKRPMTIDASVLIGATMLTERASQECGLFVKSLGLGQRPLILPTIVKPEVAGAVKRVTGDAQLAEAVAAHLDTLPGVVFVALDDALATEAAHIAIHSGIRGADAVYAVTARRFDAILVTLDKEQRNRLPAYITVCSPAEALQQ